MIGYAEAINNNDEDIIIENVYSGATIEPYYLDSKPRFVGGIVGHEKGEVSKRIRNEGVSQSYFNTTLLPKNTVSGDHVSLGLDNGQIKPGAPGTQPDQLFYLWDENIWLFAAGKYPELNI
ncbi:MAG TPA: hypothetical protein VI522_00890 [Gammaproteobacteria bacterium]|nr:hypothetical protein [Gammaproteobacteria bacterium]